MAISVNHLSPVPLHIQIEEQLRELIKEQEYLDGKPLPKEVDLSKMLGVARNTIRQAFDKLVHEGHIYRKKGVGSFVNQEPLLTHLNNWKSFSEEMNQQGIELVNYEVDSKFVEADERVSQKLKVNEGKEVLRLDRLRGDISNPFVLFISWFHPRIGLNGQENFDQPLYEMLEKKYSTIPMTSKEEIKALSASNEIAEKLRIDVGTPILYRERQVLDPGGRVIEYNICYYRNDKFTYRIDIERDL